MTYEIVDVAAETLHRINKLKEIRKSYCESVHNESVDHQFHCIYTNSFDIFQRFDQELIELRNELCKARGE